jgi:hypothetical protein
MTLDAADWNIPAIPKDHQAKRLVDMRTDKWAIKIT